MRPYDVTGDRTIGRLQRDNKTIADFWMLTDGYRVSMHEQKPGASPTQSISMSRRKFNAFIDWYIRNQPERKKRARR